MQESGHSPTLEKEPPPSVPVVIVGAGLSGSVLSIALTRAALPHIVIDANTPDRIPAFPFLLNRQTATNLGLQVLFDSEQSLRAPMTGYSRFDTSRKGPWQHTVTEQVTPDHARPGYITTTLPQILQALPVSRENFFHGQHVDRITIDHEDVKGRPIILAVGGRQIRCQTAIDCTGTEAAIIKAMDYFFPEVRQALDHRYVRQCYGANLTGYRGPVDRLLLPEGQPGSTASAIMALDDNTAVVFAGREGRLSDLLKAWGTVDDIFLQMIGALTDCGILQNPQVAEQLYTEGFFAEGLVDITRLQPLARHGIIGFGESIGLNQPLNGNLIDYIASFAMALAPEILHYLQDGIWDPYGAMITASPFLFGPQQAAAERKSRFAAEGKGRSAALKPLYDLLVLQYGEEGLWKAVDKGFTLSEIIQAGLRHPRYGVRLLPMLMDYVKILATNRQYRWELLQQARVAVRRRSFIRGKKTAPLERPTVRSDMILQQ